MQGQRGGSRGHLAAVAGAASPLSVAAVRQTLSLAKIPQRPRWRRHGIGIRGFAVTSISHRPSFSLKSDYHGTLAQARRCLRPLVRIVVLDSPLYKRREHGELMRTERHRQFQAQYGLASDSVASLEYLHESQLGELSRDLGLRWQIYQPWYGWKWHMRPLKARLRGKRQPSRFCVLVASPSN